MVLEQPGWSLESAEPPLSGCVCEAFYAGVFLVFKIRTRRKSSQILSSQGRARGRLFQALHILFRVTNQPSTCQCWWVQGRPGSEDEG